MKRGQVWLETVIYTLIGLAILGLVLAITVPKINELRDRAIIDQTIDSLAILDSKVNEVLAAPGNKRIVEFTMKRGILQFDTQAETVTYEMLDSRTLYSEPGLSIMIGKINVTTIEGDKRHTVRLVLDYSNQNITFGGADLTEIKTFSQASIPYRFSVESREFLNGKRVIDIQEV